LVLDKLVVISDKNMSSTLTKERVDWAGGVLLVFCFALVIAQAYALIFFWWIDLPLTLLFIGGVLVYLKRHKGRPEEEHGPTYRLMSESELAEKASPGVTHDA